MWQQEQQRLRGLVDTELWMLYITLAEKYANKADNVNKERETNMLEELSDLALVMVNLAKLMTGTTRLASCLPSVSRKKSSSLIRINP